MIFVAVYAPGVTAATVTIASSPDSEISVNVVVPAFISDFVSDNPTALPYSKTITATVFLDSSSLTANLTQSAFAFTFSQVNDSSQVDGQASIYFTVSGDVKYSIGGSYGVDGPAFGQRLDVLLEITQASFPNGVAVNPNTLYHSEQIGNNNEATTYTVGGTAGHTSNILVGSATGTLHAGTLYHFFTYAGFEAETDPVGSGNVTLTFTNLVAPGGGGSGVPLPPAVYTGLASALAIGGWKRFGSRRLQA